VYSLLAQVYYPVRHRLIHNLIHSIQRLTVNTSPSLDYRKLAVDLCEVMIKWELQRIRNESEPTATAGVPTSMEVDANNGGNVVGSSAGGGSGSRSGEVPTRSADFLSMQARKRFVGGSVPSPVATTSYTDESDSAKPIDRLHADAIMNYLTRIACQVLLVEAEDVR
jgi:transformation/transcription domain-associated protein